MLRLGARIVASSALARGGDKLKGTQLLLTASDEIGKCAETAMSA